MFEFKGWTFVPNDVVLKKQILQEAHDSRLIIHLGEIKVYKGCRTSTRYVMKKDVSKYIQRCLICQKQADYFRT